LKQEAIKGDRQALAALRARKTAQLLKGSTIKGEGVLMPGHTPVIDNITKKGTIIYRAGASAVRDDGDKLQVSNQVTSEAIETALRVAMVRYGNRITVNGTPEFKAQVIKTAANSQLPITFDDPRLEQRRQVILNSQTGPKNMLNARLDNIPPVSKAPPPNRRNRLLTLSLLDSLNIKSVKKTSVPDKHEKRRATIQAEITTKKAKYINKGRSL
jgi:hypothetical protein